MTLVDAATALADDLAAATAEGDELRRLPDRVWQLLDEHGFLRALQPARWGGGEVTMLEFLDGVMQVSRANPSAGWVAGVIGVHPWQLALFAEEAQAEMWGDDPATMHSSSYNPTGHAERVDGGYRVWGRWSFSSGCHHCRGVNLGAVVRGAPGPGGAPDFRSFLLHPGQFRYEDNWFVAGLKGTGSRDVVVEETFVPEHRTQSHGDYALGSPLPGQERNDGPLYRLPWSVVFNMALASSVLGATQGFVDLWVAENADRRLGGGRRFGDDPLAQRRLADAVWVLDAAVARMRTDAVELWERAEARDTPTMTERGRYRWHLNRGCELVGTAVVDLFHAASGRTIFLDHPLQRRFQDIQGGLGHAFLVPDPVARSVGGGLLGTTTPEMIL